MEPSGKLIALCTCKTGLLGRGASVRRHTVAIGTARWSLGLNRGHGPLREVLTIVRGHRGPYNRPLGREEGAPPRLPAWPPPRLVTMRTSPPTQGLIQMRAVPQNLVARWRSRRRTHSAASGWGLEGGGWSPEGLPPTGAADPGMAPHWLQVRFHRSVSAGAAPPCVHSCSARCGWPAG